MSVFPLGGSVADTFDGDKGGPHAKEAGRIKGIPCAPRIAKQKTEAVLLLVQNPTIIRLQVFFRRKFHEKLKGK